MDTSNSSAHIAKERFYNALRDLFIGADVEGISGYIHFMKIKSRYFENVFRSLHQDIDNRLMEFPEFQEEFFDKIYSFFKRYFSETGSVYFRRTPFSEQVFDRVYTDRKDVSLFWKTHMLYYVKTDFILKSMEVSIDNQTFFFDVSGLEYKEGWEKRHFVYSLQNIDEKGRIIFKVQYSRRGKKTKINPILKHLKETEGFAGDEELLKRAFRVFEKQNEVDYFINKNPRKFLREQFNLWLYQYMFDEGTNFSETRVKQLKLIQCAVYGIIDFISQFEEELLKIWRKPKLSINSNYVITLDRIIEKKGGANVIGRIVGHSGIHRQLNEWKALGIVSDKTRPEHIFHKSGRKVQNRYRSLPLDTQYFKDLEELILSLFSNGLDRELNGWLIKSENWQALNTVINKFRNKIKLIYIDPPFNTGTNEFTMYINRFLDSAWLTMMENRLQLAKEFLHPSGSIYVRIDHHANHYVRMLLEDIFGSDNFRNELIIKRTEGKSRVEGKAFSVGTESLMFFSKGSETKLKIPVKKTDLSVQTQEFLSRLKKVEPEVYTHVNDLIDEIFWLDLDHRPGYRSTSTEISVFGQKFRAPEGRHWLLNQKRIDEALEQGRVRLSCDSCGSKIQTDSVRHDESCRNPQHKVQIYYAEESVTSNWTDLQSYAQSNFWGKKFSTENAEVLLQRIMQAATESKDDIVLDFFLGSGTTIAAAHKFQRKWIGIEMGEHFYDIVLPRMKTVLAGKQSGISQNVKWKGGGFFKYFELEQFEQALRKVKYEDSDPLEAFGADLYSQYIFLKDLKLLKALEIDYKAKKVHINWDRLYSNVDISETLSHLLGRRIKTITKTDLEFEDGSKFDITELDYQLVKPLLWWEG
ncbi:MAG: site-specific DNA-methyltransferase [Candidatus Heimdallarchaeota archaeon]